MESKDHTYAQGFLGMLTIIRLVRVGETVGLLSAADGFAVHPENTYTGAEVAAVLRESATRGVS